jgi:hypothetical protein
MAVDARLPQAKVKCGDIVNVRSADPFVRWGAATVTAVHPDGSIAVTYHRGGTYGSVRPDEYSLPRQTADPVAQRIAYTVLEHLHGFMLEYGLGCAGDVIRSFDSDGDGSISANELKAGLEYWTGEHVRPGMISMAFDAIDIDGNQLICTSELAKALDQAHSAHL